MSLKENRKENGCANGLTRRRFLAASSGAIGLAALGGLTAGCTGAKQQAAPSRPISGKRTLGRTEISVTTFGLGGTGGVKEEVFAAGLDRGVNFVHCALGYGTIQNVAAAIKGRRDKLILGLKYEDTNQQRPNYMDICLERLGTDYVDILFFPLNSPESAGRPEHRELFEKLKKEGKARFMGLTTHNRMPETVEAAVDLGYYDVVMPSYGPSAKARKALRPALDKAAEKNLGVVAMKTMVGVDPKETNHMATLLKEVLSDATVTTVVKGGLNFDRLEALLQAVDMQPTASESAAVQSYLASMEGCLCLMCGQCPTCPKGVNIADIMRSFGYYYAQNSDLQLARATYAELAPAERGSACDNCGECNTQCPHGLTIAKNIQAAELMLG